MTQLFGTFEFGAHKGTRRRPGQTAVGEECDSEDTHVNNGTHRDASHVTNPCCESVSLAVVFVTSGMTACRQADPPAFQAHGKGPGSAHYVLIGSVRSCFVRPTPPHGVR
jgi:hypothetical protein